MSKCEDSKNHNEAFEKLMSDSFPSEFGTSYSHKTRTTYKNAYDFFAKAFAEYDTTKKHYENESLELETTILSVAEGLNLVLSDLIKLYRSLGKDGLCSDCAAEYKNTFAKTIALFGASLALDAKAEK